MKVAEYTTRAPVILPEILDTVSSHNPFFYNPTIEREALATHISGSFCVSITAATGIPKLETGPQKSNQSMAISNQHLNWSSSLPFIAASQPARPRLVWIVHFLLFCWSFPLAFPSLSSWYSFVWYIPDRTGSTYELNTHSPEPCWNGSLH